MAVTTWGYDDTSIFFNLRELTVVDLSQNNLSGEVDVLFAPKLKHANFIHNNFTTVNSYKKFKGLYKTLQVCDLSYYSIQQEARKLMKNMPPTIEQLFLSENQIHSILSTSLERQVNFRQLHMGNNLLSGELPDFQHCFQICRF